MATTIFVKLDQDDWVEISVSAKRAYVSNITDTGVTYVEANDKPPTSQLFGHLLNPHEILHYTLDPLSRVWMRSIRNNGLIALSPGPTFFDGLDILLPDNFIFQNNDNFTFQDGSNFELNQL